MPGGLINIATYGSQDLFLTGTPEITYFKLVYRRHTNFSMESVRLKFEDSINFDKYTTLTFPKSGDLIHKCYLEITLPEIYFTRTLNQTKIRELSDLYLKYILDYDTVNCFMNLNIEAYRQAIEVYNLDNVNNPSEMITAIEEVFAYPEKYCNNPNIIEDFKNLLNSTILDPKSPIINKYILCKFYYDCISMLAVSQSTTGEALLDKEIFKKSLDYTYNLNMCVVEYYQWLLEITKKEIEEEKNTNFKFAWVKRLGHSIIDYVSIYIGGDIIDKHYGEWIDIWYELTSDKNLDEPYLKMIGDIPGLTDFNRETKPKTILYVPLVFWFNRFNGQALPLISLQYHDVQLGLKIRKFSQLSYIEDIGSRVNLDNLFEDSGFQININLITDYIYLDSPERRKFAQSSHEYLIDVVQHQIEDNDIEEYKTRLEFTNPSKEIIWIVQRKSLQNNYSGHNQCYWTNYGVYLDGNTNPCLDCQIFINGNKLLDKQLGQYYNYLVPYYLHTRTPIDGINCYSFSLMPEEHQPSGSCNMSRVTISQLALNIHPDMLLELNRTTGKTTDISEIMSIRVFSLSQNILRIIGGMGALAFT